MGQRALLKSWTDDDRNYGLHGFIPLDQFARSGSELIIESACGVMIRDIHGKEYIDATSGLCCVNIGHGREEMAQAAAEQMRKLTYYHSANKATNTAAIEYCRRLAEFLPDGMQRTFLANSGAEANESAYKIARFYWANQGREGKSQIVSRDLGYHGLNLATTWVTGIDQAHKKVGPPLPGFLKIPACYCHRCPLKKEYPGCDLACAEALAELIGAEGAETIAAFVAEPIYGSAGSIFPPPEYFPRMREICDNYEVLLILDEVITGFGRTGKNFCCQHWNVVPDLMCISKGMNSAYLPISGVVMTEKIFEGMLGPDPLPHIYTAGGHPVVCAVAQKNLEIIVREKLVENSAQMGAYMLDRLTKALADHPNVVSVQGLGLFLGIEMDKDKKTKEPYPEAEMIKLCQSIAERGVMVRFARTVLQIAPPLCLTQDEADQICAAVEAAYGEIR